ncbi:MAG TPA: thioredoxin family protein [Chitinophagaceae bacterium]|nr:thioredoxin family protein [Chitinophagaceae bacterium]
MKKLLFSALMIWCGLAAYGQDMTKFKLYKPAEDAEAGIAKAIQEAKSKGRHVFIQVGGNWCIWCARFNDFVTTDNSIDSLVQANYVVYHLNYSPENKNEKILARYGYPQRFGFPVFIVLDENGNRLHTQNSAYLEKDKSYDRNKVIGFFNDWTPAAVKPETYKEDE